MHRLRRGIAITDCAGIRKTINRYLPVTACSRLRVRQRRIERSRRFEHELGLHRHQIAACFAGCGKKMEVGGRRRKIQTANGSDIGWRAAVVAELRKNTY